VCVKCLNAEQSLETAFYVASRLRQRELHGQLRCFGMWYCSCCVPFSDNPLLTQRLVPQLTTT
jgi:hypothetical protein